MDHRIALKPNTPLRLYSNKGGVIHCVIEKEIGRGSSCIVYEVSCETDTGDKTFYRLKECYPYKLNITRKENNLLVPSRQDATAFENVQKQFRSDFSRTNRLFYSDANYALITNPLGVFEHNGTSYILSAYSSKDTLTSYKPNSIKECVSIVKQVAYAIENIHRNGYLYLDIKPDNVLIVDGMQKHIQLFDFDSLLAIADVKNYKNLTLEDIRLIVFKGFCSHRTSNCKIKAFRTAHRCV